MPIGRAVKQQHDVTILVEDGAALSQAFGLFDGSVEISNFNRKLRATEKYQVRGGLTSARHTDREFITFTLTIQMVNFSGSVENASAAEAANPQDVFNRSGAWAAATSTLPVRQGGSDVFCVDVTVQMEGTDLGDPDDHEVKFKAVHGRVSASSGTPNTWSIECEVLGETEGDVALIEA